MRVLIVHNRYRSAQPSGENAVVEDESRLLAEHGCHMRALEVASDEITNWPIGRKAALPFRVAWSLDGYERTKAAIRDFRADVVHFHNTFPLLSPSALWAARRSPAAVVQTLHNFRPLCPAGTFLREGAICEACLGRLPLPGLRFGCYRNSKAATAPVAAMIALHRALGTWRRCVDRFIAPSEFARSKYVQAGWPSGSIVAKPNTAPDPGIRRAGPGSTFVYVGRLSHEKGLDVLLKAWERAFPAGGQRLVVVGSGEDETSLRERARPLAGVTFAGRLERSQVGGVLADARALVVPSRSYELFPRTVVEAYAAGVPVVASRLGSLPEIVDEGRTGLLFSPGSSADLADKLKRVAGDPPLSVELGAGARSAYERLLSPDRTTRRLLEIYDEARRLRQAA